MEQQQALTMMQQGMQDTARSWKTTAAGVASAATMGALLAGGFAPLLLGGITTAAIQTLLGNLGGNALAGWLDRWAVGARDRWLNQPDQLHTVLARDLERELAQNQALSNELAVFLEQNNLIETTVSSMRDDLTHQTTLITRLGQDVRTSQIIQGKLHKLVVTQLDASTTVIRAEVRQSHQSLDQTMRDRFDQLERLMETLRTMPTPMHISNSNYASGNTIGGDLNQSVTMGNNFAGAKIGKMGDVISGDKYVGSAHVSGGTVHGSMVGTNTGTINHGNSSASSAPTLMFKLDEPLYANEESDIEVHIANPPAGRLRVVVRLSQDVQEEQWTTATSATVVTYLTPTKAGTFKLRVMLYDAENTQLATAIRSIEVIQR